MRQRTRRQKNQRKRSQGIGIEEVREERAREKARETIVYIFEHFRNLNINFGF